MRGSSEYSISHCVLDCGAIFLLPLLVGCWSIDDSQYTPQSYGQLP